jgi:hypothetical protein
MFSLRSVQIILAIVVITVLFDTSLITISNTTGGLTSSLSDISLFAGMMALFGLAQYVFLRFTEQQYRPKGIIYPVRIDLQVFARIVFLANYFLLGLLLCILIQIIYLDSYHIILLKLTIYSAYATTSVLLGLLGYQFFSWLLFRRSVILFFYSIAITVISINSLVTILLINSGYADNPDYVRPLKSLLGAFVTPDYMLNFAYVASSGTSFVLMWIATVLLLRHYSAKVGRMKYWLVVSIPLVYFLSQFQPLFLYSFRDLRLTDPVLFGIAYNLVFSATKPAGALLFGLAFWTIARIGTNDEVKTYMIISSFGVILLFTANQPLGLSFAPYPPFGLVTICYMILASYLILIGIYSSALSVAADTVLRRSIRRAINDKANLLDSIGTTQLYHQVENTVIEQTRRLSSQMEDESGVKSSLEEDEVRDYIAQAIEEIRSKKGEGDNDA